jgi:hypothetical protein
MTSIYKEVEFDLADIDTEDLLKELSEREVDGFQNEAQEDLQKIYELRKLNKDYQKELDDLLYRYIGRF